MKTMNKTHLEHFAIALIVQLLVSPTVLLHPGVTAGAFCCLVGVFLGREVAQHEFKEARLRGVSVVDLAPGEGLWRHWTFDSVMDVVTAVLGAGSALFLTFWIYFS
jgi:hypothetical protein